MTLVLALRILVVVTTFFACIFLYRSVRQLIAGNRTRNNYREVSHGCMLFAAAFLFEYLHRIVIEWKTWSAIEIGEYAFVYLVPTYVVVGIAIEARLKARSL